jgi:hypothetical protein
MLQLMKQFLTTVKFCIIFTLMPVSSVCFTEQKGEQISQHAPGGYRSHQNKVNSKSRVSITWEILKGSCTKEDVQREITRNLGRRIKLEQPVHSGFIKLHLTIDESGHMKAVIIKESSFAEELFNEKIASTVRQWVFEAKKEVPETSTEILLKFVFE